MRRPLPFLLSVSPLLFGCSSDPQILRIEVVTGHETNAMTMDPAVTNVRVTGTYESEGVVIEAEAAPGGDLDFGEVDGSLPYTFEVTGYDGAGNPVLRGRSLGGIVLEAIEGDTFQVFAQRTGAWARPPGQLLGAHVRAPAVSVGERYLLQTGGDPSASAGEAELYDLFAWAGARGEALPFAASTLWSDVTDVLALGSESGGEAAWIQEGAVLDEAPVLPEGLSSFGEIAGAGVVLSPDGRVFLIGAMRDISPTDAVVSIETDGTTTVRRLVQARAGAAALWLEDVGLVVIGGSAEGKGVEVLAENATNFAARDFPADGVLGAGAAVSSLNTVILVGGSLDGSPAKTRLLDPRCTSDCNVDELPEITPDATLTRTKTYAVVSKKILIAVGDDAAQEGLTRTFVIDDLGLTLEELPLRERRIGATSVPAPNGTLALLGGQHEDGTDALTVEMWFPE